MEYTKGELVKKTGLSSNRIKYLLLRERIKFLKKKYKSNRVINLYSGDVIEKLLEANKQMEN